MPCLQPQGLTPDVSSQRFFRNRICGSSTWSHFQSSNEGDSGFLTLVSYHIHSADLNEDDMPARTKEVITPWPFNEETTVNLRR